MNWYLTSALKIYDIVVEEVSMIKTFRDQYLDVIKNNGIDGFLNELGANSR